MNLLKLRQTKLLGLPILVVAAFSLTGCNTIESQVLNAASNVLPKAEQKPNGDYILPRFSYADDGTKFTTSSPGSTYNSLISPLTKKEKIYFTKAFVTLAHYHGCMEHGYKTYDLSQVSMVPKRSKRNCNVYNFYGSSDDFAHALLSLGRPDKNVSRSIQMKMAGANMGDAIAKGRGSSSAWSVWTQWSGYKLDGKTRSEILQEFLQISKGVHGKKDF